VIHEFLDAAECRVSGMILGKKFRSRGKDVLRDFREVVLFLVLAGYSPNFVRTFFLRRFPNLFPVLSYKGAETSVVLSVKEAREGSLRVKGEFLDLLKKYVAGPWVHDAPNWLREQYGVLGCNVECSGMDSGKDSVGDAEAVKVPAQVPAVTGDFGEDLSPGHSESAMGISPGLSIWALGQFPKLGETGGFYGEGRRVGPYRGLSKMPPSISMDREGEREPGSRGRLSVRHPFLDVAGCWIRPYRKKKRVSPVCWDRLRNFRSVVWFLVLAGYSPSYIQTFFLTEIPNLFPSLSYKGVRTSVEKAYGCAFAGELILDNEFSETLKIFRAGPWATNAPDWLRAQYGVLLTGSPAGSGSGDKDGDAEAVKVPAEVPAGVGDTVEDLVRIREFLGCWEVYSLMVPGGCVLKSGDLAFGLAHGFVALLERREKGGVSND
jgi:hypothetical protein